MINNKYVDEYIKLWKTGKIELNKERIMLIAYLENYILPRDDLYFDEEMHEDYITFTEKWYFPLEPFQKFFTAFVFLFHKEDDAVFYEQFLLLMARGAGKNGLISSLSHFFISPLHGINRYNISIVANNEKQAKTSFKEIYDVIGSREVLEDMFYRTKVEIMSYDTKSIVQFHTSNAGTKDGLRDGCVIYDEIHSYATFDTVNVFSSGLGKVPNSREFYIGTDGYVRDGFLDKTKERAIAILEGRELDDPLFPFICKIDDRKEADHPEKWGKSNPMFEGEMSAYAKGLLKKVKTQHRQLKSNPSSRMEFMTKRMNFPEVDLEKSVATWEEIWRTGFEEDEKTPRQIPDLKHRTCIGGLDYARIKDFAAVGLLFKVGDDYIWKTHSFVRKGFLDTVKLEAPIAEWEEQGLLTIVEGPVIEIHHIVNWFVRMREIYGLTKIVADTFRLDLVKAALEAEGFEIDYIRNPKAIHSLLAPRVETIFAKHNLIFGDNPLMRWYTNNVYVKTKADGNKEYLKKDEFRRKTDGFQAFIHALFKADEVLVDEADFVLADINF
ncbi:terminase large subunit [Metabacillus idriensis]|uniref:terminase TerL endonuclease subunit n=1 Tax=Metabacillus idriensis TaxID=324768 RepID=UPI00174B134D|nr:terminase TerL endonuclease subunit [Metabacillus idriensis]MCM3599000.1 terminase large subunit [Metabacillus idriensis]